MRGGSGRCEEVQVFGVLVAPQGFVPTENKRDTGFFSQIYPCGYPTKFAAYGGFFDSNSVYFGESHRP